MNSPIFRNPPWQMKAVVKQLTESVDWGLTANNIPAHWKETKGSGIKVAVLDTGIDSNHPDLKDAIVDAKDFSNSPFSFQDTNGHGTHTAGTIAARHNNIGVVGVAPECGLLIGKVLGDDGSGNGQTVAAGIRWAVSSGANIISMSLGSAFDDPNIHNEIARAIQGGIIVICAAGNDGMDNSVNYPGKYTCAVGSYGKNFQLSPFSSRGPEVVVTAPGEGIVSTFPINKGSYAELDGTSMATPFVTGTIALRLALILQKKAAFPNQAEIIKNLKESSKDAGSPGFDDDFGWGLISPDSLLVVNDPKVPGGVNTNPVETLAKFELGDYIITITKQKK